ncbi:MAG: PadR family transcriptional regulator [Gemmatimonadaceae bacterium]
MGQLFGELDQLVLLAVLRLGDEGYGIAVQREIQLTAGRSATIGAIYSTLLRLEEKGFVSSRAGEPSPVRGGRRKKLYDVQPAGREALRESLGALRALSQGLSPALDLR